MEYQKMSNLLKSTSDNLSKFRTRNWVETNDYADSYILVKGTITITGAGANADARQADE